MKRMIAAMIAVASVAVSVAVAADRSPVVVGAIYPTGATQGPGGLDEYRGVVLATEYVNARGGVGGRPIRLAFERAETGTQGRAAAGRLADADVPVIIGSYGSTVSRPVATIAQARGTVFWETGAVGELDMVASEGDRVFRFPPTGGTLGAAAVGFARDMLLPALGVPAAGRRFAVAYVDDDYGRAVAQGALAEIRSAGLTLAGSFPYTLPGADIARVIEGVAASGADVLFVAAYLDDGIALRRETLRQGLDLVASLGTSSSYCMVEFGAALGADAVGLFASDKPDGHVLDADALAPEAGAALRWAREAYQARFGGRMTAPALTGFAGAIALFQHVLPAAEELTPAGIAAAARAVDLPLGALPNGSGLSFGPPGEPGATENAGSTNVIWQWVAPGKRAVVWPPAFATEPLRLLEV